MKIADLTELAWRNLREALLRNSLTTLGIGVGVASLVAMLSLGVGLQNLASRRLTNSGLFNAVFVTPTPRERGFGRPRSSSNEEPGRPPLDSVARAQMEKLPNVVEVYPEVRLNLEVRYAGNPYRETVSGLPDSSRTDGAFEGMKGSYFSRSNADEAILQAEFAKELAPQPDTLLGKSIVLRYAEKQPLPAEANAAGGTAGNGNAESSPGGFNVVPHDTTLKIVGIVDTEPEGFGAFGRGRVFIPLAVAERVQGAQVSDLQELLGGGGGKARYASLTVRVKSPKDVEAVETAIKKMGFGTFSLLDASHNLQLVFVVFDLLLGIFGSLALVVASLGIINTLVMAILERRREIGVLKALGASDRDVRRLFFAEAGAMGLFGGILGVALGWLIGRTITFGTNIYLHSVNLPSTNISSVPVWMAAGAIGFAFIVSLAAGIYPASRAARLNPVEALRYE